MTQHIEALPVPTGPITDEEIVATLQREARDCAACADRAGRVAPQTHAFYLREVQIFDAILEKVRRLDSIEALL